MVYRGLEGNASNERYNFWIFDPAQMKFIYNQGFSDTLGGNTEIDEHKKEVTSGGTAAARVFALSIGPIAGSEIVSYLSSENQSMTTLADPNHQALIHTVEKFVGDSQR